MTWRRSTEHDPVAEAFRHVRRVYFLRPAERDEADLDRPLPIGHGQTSSQPTTVRQMLELLDVRPGHKVLDVGAGSGWTTGLLGHLVGPQGRVVGVELEPELADWGAQNLARYAMPWVSLDAADPDVLGRPDEAPFDRVLVSAAARRLPAALVDQLGPEGRLVVPVGATMHLVVRDADGATHVTEHGSYSFVPLR